MIPINLVKLSSLIFFSLDTFGELSWPWRPQHYYFCISPLSSLDAFSPWSAPSTACQALMFDCFSLWYGILARNIFDIFSRLNCTFVTVKIYLVIKIHWTTEVSGWFCLLSCLNINILDKCYQALAYLCSSIHICGYLSVFLSLLRSWLKLYHKSCWSDPLPGMETRNFEQNNFPARRRNHLGRFAKI